VVSYGTAIMKTTRVEATVDLERWNEAGTQTWDESVLVQGEVDLDAETAKVVATNPTPLDCFSERDVQAMEHALYAKAFADARKEADARAFAAEMRDLAFDLARLSAGVAS
jgi:hypothetical protein